MEYTDPRSFYEINTKELRSVRAISSLSIIPSQKVFEKWFYGARITVEQASRRVMM